MIPWFFSLPDLVLTTTYGKVTFIVGLSGAGKTTLSNMYGKPVIHGDAYYSAGEGIYDSSFPQIVENSVENDANVVIEGIQLLFLPRNLIRGTVVLKRTSFFRSIWNQCVRERTKPGKALRWLPQSIADNLFFKRTIEREWKWITSRQY